MQDPDTLTIIAGLTAAILVVVFRALAACNIDLDNPDVQDRALLHASDLALLLFAADHTDDSID